IATVLASIFALHVRDPIQQVCALLYSGAALGAVMAGDLLTLFIFWEIMALSSGFLIWARRTPRAESAGQRYLITQILSGVILLAGSIVYYGETGSLAFEALSLETLGAKLILFAFGIKCAWPFLHNWLTDAYPEATPTGTVFLSAFTTKVAVYALVRSFPGTEMLIWVGTAMAIFPIFFAVIENDLRRVLSYSLINQVGFMVVGIGLGTELALNGAVSHAFNDVVFKGLLFMSMGAVLHMTGRINGTDLGGLYKSMPWTTTFCIVGAASISAFPLFSGFVSKSMVMAAAAQEGYVVVFLLLLFASAGVFHHAGIKIPFFAFFAHDSGLRPSEAPRNMLVAMGLAAFICVFNGVYPWILYDLLPWQVDYQPYTLTHIITQTQLLFFSALAFTLLMIADLYPPELKLVNLDADWFIRRLGKALILGVGGSVMLAWSNLVSVLRAGAGGVGGYLWHSHGPRGIFSRTWPTGATVMWIGVLLVVYLLINYV
ncbi:MAG: Na(+)/H(+) antiporter subunit D, partial [Alphaproteobacteria bacterium]|nr:Na(+)/H(+) antiporter subunit D [Alphaproteobacteria bacterium]